MARSSVEAGENYKMVERLSLALNEFDTENRNKILKLEEMVTKVNGSLDERIENLNDETDNNFQQINKQVVNFESKTATLESLIQNLLEKLEVFIKKISPIRAS